MPEKNSAPADEPKRVIEAWEHAACEPLKGAPLATKRAEFAAARHLNQWADGRLLTQAELDAGFERVLALHLG